MRLSYPTLRLIIALLCAICTAPSTWSQTGPVVIPESLRTNDVPAQGLSGVAVWHSATFDEARLYVTATQADTILVLDPATGNLLRRLGTAGKKPGQLSRPDGIAIADNLLFVVERGNQRIQAFLLPDEKPIQFFGSNVLVDPRGIAAVRRGGSKDSYQLFVTDNYDYASTAPKALAIPTERVKHFDVTVDLDRMRKAETPAAITVPSAPEGVEAPVPPQSNSYIGALRPVFVNAFGDERGRGVLNRVNGIALDAAADRLYVVDEQDRNVKVYHPEGRFAGDIIGEHQFRGIPAAPFVGLSPRGNAGMLLMVADNGAGAGPGAATKLAGPAPTADTAAAAASSRADVLVFRADNGQRFGSFTGGATLADVNAATLFSSNLDRSSGGTLYMICGGSRVQSYKWDYIMQSLRLR